MQQKRGMDVTLALNKNRKIPGACITKQVQQNQDN